MNKSVVRMKQGDMVQHVDYPRLRGIVKEVTARRRNSVPRKVKVLWFPISQRNEADHVPWTVTSLMESQDDIAVMKLVVLSSSSTRSGG
jgi:hypothetical protein